MGTYNKMEDVSELRCIYRTQVDVRIDFKDRDGWQSFIELLPDSYTMTERNDKPPFIDTTFTYVAASANGNDLKRRLEQSNMQYTTYSSPQRVKLCDCPAGTKKCLVRLTESM